MTVLNEQLNDARIISEIAGWYKGKVLTITELRPNTLISDDVIPALLLQQKAPVFVTINYKDFWRKMPAHTGYCVVCFKLPLERKLKIPAKLRWVLGLDAFKTWRMRKGKVLSVIGEIVGYYEHE
ncbi:MAG: hypothetical protein ACREEM_29225 [Blastocatellia bacterium]